MRKQALKVLVALAVGLGAFTFVFLGVVRAGQGERTGVEHVGRFTFALLGDPQLGYGPGGSWADRRRFTSVVEGAARAGAELAVIPGDLVQDRAWSEQWMFDGARAASPLPLLLAAGNHDVVDRRSLEAFRARYGTDHLVHRTPTAVFVVLDSETMRDASLSQADYLEGWQSLERELAGLESDARARFAVMHRPPFVDDEREPDTDANWPGVERARLLALLRSHDVHWVLAGHLHRRRVVMSDGLTVMVLPGSARSFDGSDLGFERFVVEDGRVSHTWIRLGPGPAAPFAPPHMSGWTPRLFDFSPRHWFFTLLYAGAAWVAWRAGRRGAGSWTWRMVAWVLAVFASNWQLDWDEAVGECGRIAAKLAGIYQARHLITPVALAVLLAFAVPWVVVRMRTSGAGRTEKLASLGLVVPIGWFALSTISHHDFGMIWSEDAWDLAHLGACLWVLWLGRRGIAEAGKAK
ncbi:MAG TPA: metallophosphoesterase [Polyangiaceae bacterium]|nr:metallophosphoesterase [Polyangiaceae bacterium]